MLELTEDLFVGNGYHKKCFRHPNDSTKCVKVAYTDEGKVDLEREIKYLKILKRKNKDYSCLPKYYGPIETSLGRGYLFEFIKNYDNSMCLTIRDCCDVPKFLESNYNELVQAMKVLRRSLFDNEILTMGLFPGNFLIQNNQDGSLKLRLINDMGSASLIPIEYYFSFFAKKRIKKRWVRFTEYLNRKYEAPLVKEFINAIS